MEHDNMLTVGEIALKLDEPLHRIEYIIRSRKIVPEGRAGRLRIFTENDVERIEEEMRWIDEHRHRFDSSDHCEK